METKFTPYHGWPFTFFNESMELYDKLIYFFNYNKISMAKHCEFMSISNSVSFNINVIIFRIKNKSKVYSLHKTVSKKFGTLYEAP